MLAGIDTLVIDLQDVGVRFYTYHSTMAYVMEEAAKRKLSVVVLDRPNPINGWQIEGPDVASRRTEFISYFQMPMRHGMTMGELAKLFNEENKINADLTVIPVENWRRDYWYDDTGLAWINPSPNMRNLNQATLYPGIGAIEYSNVSVGRGTDQPFEQFGAPWIDGPRLVGGAQRAEAAGHSLLSDHLHAEVEQVRERRMPGRVHDDHESRVAAAGARRTRDRRARSRRCSERNTISRRRGDCLEPADPLERVKQGEDPAAVAARWTADEARWRRLRAKYLLYR